MTDTPSHCPPLPSSDFESQYSRVFEAAGCRTQEELADLLNIRQSSISDAKRRQSIPSDWLIKLFEKRRANPDWIRTGLGGKTIQANGAADFPPTPVTVIERRPPEHCTTDELLAELARRALKNMG